MKMILDPFNNEITAGCYETLADAGFYKRGLDSEIRKYLSPFICINTDTIDNFELERFYWEMNYFVSLCYLTPDEIVLKTGMNYFKSEIEKSNIYLISTLVKRICIKNNSLELSYEAKKSEKSVRGVISGMVSRLLCSAASMA